MWTWLLFFAFVAISVNSICGWTKDGDTELKTRPQGREEQRHECHKNESVSEIYWDDVSNEYKIFHITCEHRNKTCKTKCKWTLHCNIARYGEGSYVRGIRVLYEPHHHYQSILFLCCKGKNVSEDICDYKFKQLDGKIHPSEEETTTIRQARSNYPGNNPIEIFVEKCLVDHKNKSCGPGGGGGNHGNGDGDGEEDDDYDMAGLTGLAGLAGLGGLALIAKPASQTSGTQTCCCQMPGATCPACPDAGACPGISSDGTVCASTYFSICPSEGPTGGACGFTDVCGTYQT